MFFSGRSISNRVIKDGNIVIAVRFVCDRIIKSSYCTIIMGSVCVFSRICSVREPERSWMVVHGKEEDTD